MKAKNAPKALAGMLAAVLTLAPAMQAGATSSTYSDYYGGTGSTMISGGQTGTVEDGSSYIDRVVSPTPQATVAPTATPRPTPTAVPQTSAEPSPQSSPEEREEASPEPSGTAEPAEAGVEEATPTPETKPTPGKSASPASGIPEKDRVAGNETTITGVYLATDVDGCAVITDQETIRENYDLGEKQELFAKFINLNGVESPVSRKMLDLAAESQKAEICARIGIELGTMESGKYSLLPSEGAAIRIMLGIPEKERDEEQTYAVVCVRKDGTVHIFEDQDFDSDTVTFSTTGGAGAYALIRY